MIIYFSATGNNKFIAKKLAKELNDTAMSIQETTNIKLKSGEKLGFVFPTYFWRLPSLVDDFMDKLNITTESKNPYIYFIASYGSTCGGTATYMKRHLREKKLKISFFYSIKTVDNWTIGYSVNNSEEIKSTLEREKEQIDEVINLIKADTTGNKMKDTLPMFLVMGSNTFYKKARKTKHFKVLYSCIGCGLCEKNCHSKAIKIVNNKPTWTKLECTLCLGCLHKCPKFAIQYEDKTKNNGQYIHPDTF